MSTASLSAGILLHRSARDGVEVLLVLPGGPYWARRDVGAWQLPKGGIEAGEDAVTAAIREFEEELGTRPEGRPRPLGQIRQSGGKRVEAFAVEGDFDVERMVSVMFEMEWPPKSGRRASFPEVARAAWYPIRVAREVMLASQRPLLDRLEVLLAKEG